MKRRFFTRSVACTAIGTAMPLRQTFSQVMIPTGKALLQNLIRAEWALLIHRRVRPIQGAASFDLAIQEKQIIWSTQGYHPVFEHAWFFGPNERFCFLPILNHHSASGHSDVLLPVFALNRDNQWEYAHTLSGYQLDTMLKAAHALRTNRAESLQRLLLPVGKAGATDNKGAFATQEGLVETITTVLKGRATTCCTVRDSSGIVFSDSFRHS